MSKGYTGYEIGLALCEIDVSNFIILGGIVSKSETLTEREFVNCYFYYI